MTHCCVIWKKFLLCAMYLVSLAIVVWVAVLKFPNLKAGKSTVMWWHPVLMTTGFFFFMLWGIVYKKADPDRNKNRLWHGIFSVCGTVCMVAGFLVIFLEKDSHFSKRSSRIFNGHGSRTDGDYHGIFGIIALGLMVLPLLFGLCVFPACTIQSVRKSPCTAWVHANFGRFMVTFVFTGVCWKIWEENWNPTKDGAPENAMGKAGVIAFICCIVFLKCWLCCGLAPDMSFDSVAIEAKQSKATDAQKKKAAESRAKREKEAEERWKEKQDGTPNARNEEESPQDLEAQ